VLSYYSWPSDRITTAFVLPRTRERVALLRESRVDLGGWKGVEGRGGSGVMLCYEVVREGGVSSPLIRVNPGSIFGWGLIFIFGGLVNFIFYF
jgi:hypothetical protein